MSRGGSYTVRLRYCLTVVNVGSRPLYVQDLAILNRHDGHPPSTGRIMKYQGETWDVIVGSDIPKTLEPGEGTQVEGSWPEGPVEVAIGLVEVAGHQREFVDLVSGM